MTHPVLHSAQATEPSGPVQVPPVGAWGLDAFLAGLSLAMVPLGNATFPTGSGDVAIPYYSMPVALLAANLLLRVLFPGRRPYPKLRRRLGLAVVLIAIMTTAEATHGLSALGVYGLGQFAVGTLAGILVGSVWSRAARRAGWVDLGAGFFLMATVLQLMLLFRGAGGPSGFHRAAVLSWGGSNYVAGVLVVVSLTLASRMRELGYRPALLLLPAAGLAAAGLTFSRGALVAAALGLLVLFWNVGRTSVGRGLLRTFGVAAASAAVPVLQYFVATRSAGGYDPSQNVDTRITLFRAAWQQFLSAPFTGTGWFAMRRVGLFAVDISFAHNLVLSFLQIAGILGGSVVLILVVLSYRSVRQSSMTGGAVVAALAISMTDPFFEGGVGAMVAWAAVLYGLDRQVVRMDDDLTSPAATRIDHGLEPSRSGRARPLRAR